MDYVKTPDPHTAPRCRTGSSVVLCDSRTATNPRFFEENARIHVITHTADENLAKACARIPSEFGYYEIESRYDSPPQSVKSEFPTADRLT